MVSSEKMPRNSSASDSMERVEGLAGERVHGGVAEGHGPASLGHGGTSSGGWGVGAGDLAAAGGPARGRAGDHPEGGGQADQGAGPEPVVGPVAVAVGLHQPGRFQDLEVVTDQRLGGRQLLGEMGDAQLLGSQQLDDPPAQRVTQRPGQLHRLGGGVGWSDSGSDGHGHLHQSTLILIAEQVSTLDLATS